MSTFGQLNKNIVFATANTRKEASQLISKAKKDVEAGQSIVIFFDNRYLLNIAPGQDPYQLRNDIDKWLITQKNKSKSDEIDNSISSSTSKKKSSKS